MIRRALAVAVVSLALAAVPAAACDPDCDDEWSEPEPVYEPPDPPEREAPEPVERTDPPEREVPEPVERADPPEREAPEPAYERPEPPEREAPVVEREAPVIEVPEGLHYVTETYTGDVVSRSGPTTTYSTATVDMSPGTYARAVDSVPTGSASPYDGSAFNGRVHMGDGRAVAGTYYENFVLTGSGFVSVSIVFFQDDQETAIATPPPPPPPSFPPLVSNVPAAAPVTLPAFPVPAIVTAPAPAAAAIIDEERAPAPATSTPTTASSSTAGSPGTSPTLPGSGPGGAPRTPVLRVGIAPGPQADMLATLEVMRGRRVNLWPRATIDGSPATVREWRASGELTSLGPLSGSGDEPLVARWDALATPDGAWLVRFEMTVDVPGVGPSRADAVLAVTVRSPALIR